MTDLYPLRFFPIYKDKIWGGNKIKTLLHKDYGILKNCGESWELSGVEGNISVVANGSLKGKLLTDVIQSQPEGYLGRKLARKSNKFPLLIKFLDADDDLSIQVHPNDELAKKKHGGFGKTEMWYIIDAEPGSTLLSGFNQHVTREQFLNICKEDRVLEILNKEKVKSGDTFYIPSGRIHSIGKGILLAEIQQTSDITYRIYDFNRVGNDGKLRQLHIADAADALDFHVPDSYRNAYDRNNDESVLVDCEYFTTCRLKGNHEFERVLNDTDSFRVYIVVEGSAHIHWSGQHMAMKIGDVFLVPSGLVKYKITGNDNFCGLEVFIK